MSKKKWSQVDKAYTFFLESFKAGHEFSLEELAENTGWSVSTVKTYLGKKWALLLERGSRGFKVTEAITTFNVTTFRQHQSQKDEVDKYLHQIMLEKSISACISAIEIYNKPNFLHREETFSILMTNAWELLLKSKLVKEAGDSPQAIHIVNKGDVVISPSGNPKTIALGTALNRLLANGSVPAVVGDNIRLLMNIRDDSVHFVCGDLELSTRIQEIGTASLKNFMTLAMHWFNYDFSRYNFYLMPVSFFHLSDVASFSVDSTVKSNLLNYLKSIEKEHEHDKDANYAISLKLHTKLVKTTNDEALQVRLTNDPDAPEIVFSEEDALKNYPHDYNELLDILKARYTNFKQNKVFHDQMRILKAEGERYCKVRRLDPDNPKSINKTFYHNRVIDQFDQWYERVRIK
ncbi:DUF3644 domain-containing protein [Vibrio cholerae]|nr:MULTISPECIES: DUF3644 domain-containing protein [Vibrio]ATD29086.1 hypothetical protein FORC55_3102 [Vibrio cholerae]EGQ9414903.1 DUF3644 domain-containing protein [Vibrio cholerae]EGQ9418526.1 DUF3644 domain-containing protein [Vibrio cholerae]EGR1113470.1 DUF3644 domain-containing protein [Vibrio cholerae]EGR1137492.1 DUF3644 domain-containing protein [Vibrio cholerae]